MRRDEIAAMEREVAKLQVIKKKIDAGIATDEERAYFEISTQNAVAGAKTELIAGVVGLLVAGGFVVWLAWGFGMFEPSEPENERNRETVSHARQAQHVCEQAVLGQLLDADGARFSGVRVAEAVTGDIVSIYDVTGSVVARNSLGGMASAQFSCSANLYANGWTTSDIEISN